MRYVLLCTALVAAAPAARAFTIATGLSEGCHEAITVRAVGDGGFPLTDGAVLPHDDCFFEEMYQLLEEAIPEALGAENRPRFIDSPLERWFTVSLLLGARSNDTRGHAVLDLDTLRAVHADPSGETQHLHCLRGAGEDGPEGDRAALEGTRQFIKQRIELAREIATYPAEGRSLGVRIFVDHYGDVPVVVYGPLFRLGEAIHALQDCYSHNLRNPDDGFRTPRHVFNFAEAILDTHEVHQDGEAHSNAFDRCKDEGLPLAGGAEIATAELLEAVAQSNGTIAAVLDAHMTLQPDCTIENDYCGTTTWLRVARTDQTKPFLGGCQASGQGAPDTALALLLFGALFMLLRRPHRRR